MSTRMELLETSLPPVILAGRMRGRGEGPMIFLDTHRPLPPGDGAAFSIIGRRPWRTLSSHEGICRMDRHAFSGTVWDMLKTALAGQREHSLLPDTDCLFGYLSYDLGLPGLDVPIPPRRADDPVLPDALFFAFDELVVHDHRDGRTWLAAGGRLRPAGESLAVLRTLLSASLDPAEIPPTREQMMAEPTPPESRLSSNFSHDAYLPLVERIREYIGAGDTYIVNLSRRICADATRPPWEMYLRLRAFSPVPFGAFLETGQLDGMEPQEGFAVLSASMERYLRVRDGVASTCPIKGTRPRGKTPEEDTRNRLELLESEKDRAELLMIVDLERNDLSRVCTPESVEVRDLFRLEAYASVFHLDATVQGQLAADHDAVDALAALFPGGSITGAPKIRSMEIISELEDTRRGLYTGSLGWLSPDGRADFSILIRTLVRQHDRVWYSTGGGITWYSDPESEYRETEDKARFLERVV